MNNLIDILSEKLGPIAAYLEGNKYINGVRRGFVMLIPLILIGSLFLLIAHFPANIYQETMKSIFGNSWKEIVNIPIKAIFSMLAVYSTFFVAQQLAYQFELDSASIGVISIIAFIIVTPFVNRGGEELISFEWLGSKGIFISIIIGIITVIIFKFFVKRDILIKMPEGIPPEVIKSFEALIPGAVVLILAILIRVLMMKTSFGDIHSFIYEIVAIPVRYISTSYLGSMIIVFLISIMWSVGINSGSVINGIMRPIWLENQLENIEALKNGLELPHIVTEQFFDMIWMGGSGASLSLLLAIVFFIKSKHLKSVGEVALIPGIFNINEPLIFGVPIILNPIMLIPFNIVPLVFVTTQYMAMTFEIVGKPIGVAVPWTTPAIINGFFITGGISGALLQIVNLIIGALIYLPFIKVIDKISKKEEEKSLV